MKKLLLAKNKNQKRNMHFIVSTNVLGDLGNCPIPSKASHSSEFSLLHAVLWNEIELYYSITLYNMLYIMFNFSPHKARHNIRCLDVWSIPTLQRCRCHGKECCRKRFVKYCENLPCDLTVNNNIKIWRNC